MSWEYSAELVRVVDGDTVVLKVTKDFELPVDFGFHVLDTVHLHKSAVMSFRLQGINAPELVGATYEAGRASKAALENLLAMGPIRAVTTKPDKYGRWLVTLYVSPPSGIEVDVNAAMVESGFAVPYMVTS